MPAIAFYPEQDARVNANDPDTVQAQGYLCAGTDVINLGAGYHGTSYAWMKFNLAGIPLTATINSATLYCNGFYIQGDYAPLSITVFDSSDISWTEAAITWNSQPSFGASTMGTFTFDPAERQEFSVSLATTPVKTALTPGKISLVISCDDNSQSGAAAPCVAMQDYDYTSPAPATRYPYLLIVYTLAASGHTSAIPKGSISLTGRAPGATTTDRHRTSIPLLSLVATPRAPGATKTDYVPINRLGTAAARRHGVRADTFLEAAASERSAHGRSDSTTNISESRRSISGRSNPVTNTSGSTRSAKSRGNRRA